MLRSSKLAGVVHTHLQQTVKLGKMKVGESEVNLGYTQDPISKAKGRITCSVSSK